MTKLPALLLLWCILTLASLPTDGQTIPPEYQVGRWQGFREAAVSFTFDDGTPNQLPVAVPLLDEFGFRATFFTVTGWSPDWTGLANASENGHEIASHTVTHPDLTTIGGTAQITELRESHDAIVANIPTAGSQTLAYPFCKKGSEVGTNLYYFAARGCQGSVESPTPGDFLNISSMIVGSESAIQTAVNLNARVSSAAGSGGWAVFLIHGVDGDGGYSPVPSTELRTHFEYLLEHDATYWIETFGNVARYIRERDAVRITELSAGADEITLSLSDNLDDATYNFPLSVRRELPAGWPGVSVEQNGHAVESEVVQVESTSYVSFGAVPDAGDVTLSKSDATGIGSSELPDRSSVLDTYPNPAEARVTMDYRIGRDAFVMLEVFDLLGRRVHTLVDGFLPAGRYTHVWETDRVRPGPYVYRLVSSSDVDTGVIVVI